MRELPEKFLVAFSFAGEQRDLVRSIAEAVERRLGRGTVFLDEWFQHYIAGNDADLRLQKLYGEQCELAIVCVSKRYGDKPWTRAEHAAIRARQMKLQGSKVKGDEHRMLPIRVGEGDVEGILFNAILPDVRGKSADETTELIVGRLHLIIPSLKQENAPLPADGSWPETPPPLDWPMADHTGAREAFGRLLTCKAPWRYLPIRGPSETGKSHITRQMLANALRMPDLACGRFDFKGTTDMDAEVRAFVQYLDVTPPTSGSRLNERLTHILTALKRRARPALLVFDTFEAAGETKDWAEKELLPSLIRSTWLRVVIAGQCVPTDAGAVWKSVARTQLQLAVPPPADWFDYGKQHRPDLTLVDVETACRLASHKASLLAQLLGPSI